jgi:hypothetical protein
MSSGLVGKRVVILSDNEMLARAVELNLCHRLGMQIVSPEASAMQQLAGHGSGIALDLIVVALSSPESEPNLMLARASLLGDMGRTPLLVISNKQFKQRPDRRSAHLGFPFVPERLADKVKRILSSERR